MSIAEEKRDPIENEIVGYKIVNSILPNVYSF